MPSPDPSSTVIGPLRYEVVEPLRAIRVVLEPNEAQPLAFDVTEGHGDFRARRAPRAITQS